MRRYRFAPIAAAALDAQIDYLVSKHAVAAARALERRFRAYVVGTLCPYPFIGRHIPERNVYESWIPGTRLVVWYTVSDEEIVIAMVWHASQNRSDPDAHDI